MRRAVVIGGNGNIGTAVSRHLESLNYECFIPPGDATEPGYYDNVPADIDAAIYLPGISILAPITELTNDNWETVIRVNLTGAFLLAKHVFHGLQEREGCFITISSILSQHPYPNRVAYAAAKCGLEGLTRGLAVEGLFTHCIRLGHLATFTSSWPKNRKVLEAVQERTPSKRLVTAEEVASYIGWLTEGGCKAVSGSVIDFDPAFCINRWPL